MQIPYPLVPSPLINQMLQKPNRMTEIIRYGNNLPVWGEGQDEGF